MDSLQSVKNMTTDQVQLELIEVKNVLRALEASAKAQIDSIKIDALQRTRLIKVKAEHDTAIVKS
jgi:hypothetical protein